ncbi:MAG: hypothetical protein WCG03_07610 [Kiritimatiellales bacterium]|jgi:hypothetical protein
MSNGNEFLAELEPIREALTVWRGNPGKERKIPGSVWEQAIILAKKYGIQAVSKELKLSHGDLKRHVTGGAGRQYRETGLMPTFIEVKPESAAEEVGCVIELTKGSGTRLRISLKSAGSVDWCRIKEAFLGA